MPRLIYITKRNSIITTSIEIRKIDKPKTIDYNMKIFFPEPIFSLDQISTSTFLYFQKNLAYTLHPTVSLYQTGCDPFKFLEILEHSEYNFKSKFKSIFEVVQGSTYSIHQTLNLIQPIQAKGYSKSIWLVYPRNEAALSRSETLIAKSGLSKQELLNIIDPVMASHELIAHILFEKFLEIYDSKVDKDFSNIKTKTFDEIVLKDIDYKELLSYCDSLFKKYEIEDLLIMTYFFRFQAFEKFPDILLTNEKLLQFLENINSNKIHSDLNHFENNDVISWEIFKQLTGKYLEEKSSEEQITKVLNLLDNSNEEIENLKNKCSQLAEQFKGERDLINLQKNIAKHVQIYTEKEISDLLKLPKGIAENVIDAIFSDEKTWIAFGVLLYSLLTGGPLLTASAALAAFSNVAAKTYKEVAEFEKSINKSDYSLIYKIKN